MRHTCAYACTARATPARPGTSCASLVEIETSAALRRCRCVVPSSLKQQVHGMHMRMHMHVHRCAVCTSRGARAAAAPVHMYTWRARVRLHTTPYLCAVHVLALCSALCRCVGGPSPPRCTCTCTRSGHVHVHAAPAFVWPVRRVISLSAAKELGD